jgi:hypothetical protein
VPKRQATMRVLSGLVQGLHPGDDEMRSRPDKFLLI